MIKHFIIYMLLVLPTISFSQVKESQVKAIYIYKLAEMINWSNESEIDTFNFGFFTKDSILIDYYKHARLLRNKPIKFSFNNDIKDIFEMQCIFIDYQYKNKLKTISHLIAKHPILLISYKASTPDLSMVNIYKQKNTTNLRFEIFKKNLDKSGFIYKNELLLIGGNNINDFKELYITTNKKLENKIEEFDSVTKNLKELKKQSLEYQKQLNSLSNNLQNINEEITKKRQNISQKDSTLQTLNKKLKKQKLQRQELYSKLKNKIDSMTVAENKLQLLNSEFKKTREEIYTNQIKINKQKKDIENQKIKINKQNKRILTISLLGIILIIILFLVFIALRTKKNLAKRLEILVNEKTKSLNESRLYYQSLFEDSPVSICEFDLSELVNHLKNDYDITSEKLNMFDDFILQATRKIKINDTNFQTLHLFNSVSKQEFTSNYHKLFNTDSISGLKDFYIKLLKGEVQFNYEIRRVSFKNKPIDLVQSVYVLPNSSNPFSKVIVSMLNITKLKEYEREITQHRDNLEELVEKRTKKIIALNENLTTVNKQINEQKEELLTTLNKLKDTQSQLVESEKMASLGMLTSGVAHEINNPINFINSGNQALEMIINNIWKEIEKINNITLSNKNDLEIKSEIKIVLDKIKNEDYNSIITDILKNIQMGVNRVVEIVKSLQNYSRKSNDKNTLVDIKKVIDESLIILNNKFKNRIKITKTIEDIPPFICASGKIEQVLINLLSNAFDAIKNEGSVDISAKLNKNKTVEIYIKDSGCGIKKEYLKKIFDPFFTTKDPDKGTGLGMYITYGIIKQLKGNINIESKENKGTTIIVSLPFKTSK